MKQRPILFNGDMVRALLAGTKTQTRRIVKPQPDMVPLGFPTIHTKDDQKFGRLGIVLKCPYGQVGDQLWVRETFCIENTSDYHGDHTTPTDGRPIQKHDIEYDYWLIPHYRASEPEPNIISYEQEEDDNKTRWKPSIFMPRWASRITLEITHIHVEQLNDLEYAGAIAEGVKADSDGNGYSVGNDDRHYSDDPIDSYASLWESTNGEGSWEVNPLVWVVEFKRVEQP